MLSALVLAAAVAQAAPPIIVPPVAPPRAPIVRTGARIGPDTVVLNANPDAIIPVRVRIMAGGNQLLNDTFRVSRNGSASYQESRSEAPQPCGEEQRSYGSQERYSLNMNLYLRYEGMGGPMVNVSVSWGRPSANTICAGEGSRQVQLSQTVPLAPGQSVTLQGDAGLSVTLSR